MGSEWRFSSGVLILAVIFFLDSCYSEKAPYPTFAKDATLAPPVLHYDYIIIGGGTSGCSLAATLSEKANVLLLERGGLPYGNPTITNITGFITTLANLSPSSPSQTFVSTDGVVNHRARVLGGGSALNAGFYTRASADYVSREGWNKKMVEESYEWVEKKVAFKPPVLQWQSAVRDGLLEAGVTPNNGFTYEHIFGTKVGGTIFDETGHRHTAADLLEYANPQKISLYLRATVHQILFTTEGVPRPKANAVIFKDSNGNKHIAYLNQESNIKNEIILSAGTLGSPQLLMLSGIGPAAHLKAHGIKVVLDQPMVGQGMSDNSMNLILVPSSRPVEISLIQVVGITQFGSYIEAASAPIDLAMARRMVRDLGYYLNQNGYTVPSLPQSQKNIPGLDLKLGSSLNGGIILQKIMGPRSTGHLELHTTDPADNPIVTFNYYQDPQDLERCVQGLITIIKVIESKAMSTFRPPLVTAQALMNLMLSIPSNLRPRHVESTFSLEQYCKDTVMTIWHYHGGAQVDHVVDRDYKVFGVDSLRVIDSSTLLNSPGTNPQATMMMLGRYMGQKILGERYPQ